MNPTLEILIERFRGAQDIGVAKLIHELAVPRPTSGVDWVHYCSQSGLYKTNEIRGVGVYAHGYGIELKIGPLTIDFDWGANGEPDGFDGWRLYNFALDNLPDIECTHADVNGWLDDALGDGELTKEGNLYYDPNRRVGNAAAKS